MTRFRVLALTLLIAGGALAFLLPGTGPLPEAGPQAEPFDVATFVVTCHEICTNEENLCLQGCLPGDYSCQLACARVYINCSRNCDTSGCSPAHPQYPNCPPPE